MRGPGATVAPPGVWRSEKVQAAAGVLRSALATELSLTLDLDLATVIASRIVDRLDRLQRRLDNDAPRGRSVTAHERREHP